MMAEKPDPDSPLSPCGRELERGGIHNTMDKAQTTGLARGFRRRETEAEQILWSWLRNKQMNGIKFRRQQPLGDYVVDFVSFDKKLIIEIDGGQHNEELVIEKDESRTRRLESFGFRVISFWNNDVLSNTDGVITMIKNALL